MKKIIIIIILVLSFQGCTDLEESPESNLTVNQFYKTTEDAVSAVNAIYHRMFTEWLVLYNRQLMMLEMATDDVSAGPRTRSSQVIDLSKINYVPNNTGLNWTWQYSYDAINRANIAIDRISVLDPGVIDSKLQDRLLNEAKFLRAWNYFNLVRWFGSVPLIVHETSSLSPGELHISNTPEEQIYELIIKDLKAAELLPAPGSYPDVDAGRATAGAAKALLAKVYLRQGEWQKSASKAKELMDSGWYGLFEDFSDVFSPESKNGKEHIFFHSI
ncbi:RagB/SusD family nutrient uptake outer membrane protein [Galbibacter sp. PAP.153]|uniref:RagB/SusD family nutrient uptake outer membrane protein n=1 Tax=Galbibacter sp. PAP.153 TaxID=3104623 RepID=UPI00300B2C67